MADILTEEDILQITNDIAEDMLAKRVSKTQLVQCINYWRNKYETSVYDAKMERIENMVEYIENYGR